MVASSGKAKSASRFSEEQVGSQSYLNRHNTEMFTEGKSFSGNERDKLFLNRGDGTFADVSDLSGCDSPNDGRAVLANDFDGDGDVDLFVHELQRERHALYRNDRARDGAFVKVRLRATRGQWEGIGATIYGKRLSTTVAQVASRGSGFVSCPAPEGVFGLGDDPELELSVRWPGGEVESFGKVARGSRVLLVEGAGKPEPFTESPVEFADPGPAGLRIAVGEELGAFRVADASGDVSEVSGRALAGGETLYLNFWASWCASCIGELPALEQLNEQAGVRVLGLSVDVADDRETARRMFEGRASYATHYLLGKDEGEAGDFGGLSEAFDFERLPIPTTLVVNPDGRVERVITGALE